MHTYKRSTSSQRNNYIYIYKDWAKFPCCIILWTSVTFNDINWVMVERWLKKNTQNLLYFSISKISVLCQPVCAFSSMFRLVTGDRPSVTVWLAHMATHRSDASGWWMAVRNQNNGNGKCVYWLPACMGFSSINVVAHVRRMVQV